MTFRTYVITAAALALLSGRGLAEPVARVGGAAVMQEDIDTLFGDTAEDRDLYRSMAVVSVALARNMMRFGGADARELDGVGLGAAMSFMAAFDKNALDAARKAIPEQVYRDAFEAARAKSPVTSSGPSWAAADGDVRAVFTASYLEKVAHRTTCDAVRDALAREPITWIVPEPAAWKSRYAIPANCE